MCIKSSDNKWHNGHQQRLFILSFLIIIINDQQAEFHPRPSWKSLRCKHSEIILVRVIWLYLYICGQDTNIWILNVIVTLNFYKVKALYVIHMSPFTHMTLIPVGTRHGNHMVMMWKIHVVLMWSLCGMWKLKPHELLMCKTCDIIHVETRRLIYVFFIFIFHQYTISNKHVLIMWKRCGKEVAQFTWFSSLYSTNILHQKQWLNNNDT